MTPNLTLAVREKIGGRRNTHQCCRGADPSESMKTVKDGSCTLVARILQKKVKLTSIHREYINNTNTLRALKYPRQQCHNIGVNLTFFFFITYVSILLTWQMGIGVNTVNVFQYPNEDSNVKTLVLV